MLPQPETGAAKAARHYRRAGEYQALARNLRASAAGNIGNAEILPAAGGALLYEAAKQCVNAVANLYGRDPQANHEKMAALRIVANAHPHYPHLVRDAREAWQLHIHADQGHLTQREYAFAVACTGRFVGDMRAIYRAAGGAVAG